MNYKCPTCRFPKLCGRLFRGTFFGGEKLVDYKIEDSCRNCGTSWKSIAKVGKNKFEYDRMEFLEIVTKEGINNV